MKIERAEPSREPSADVLLQDVERIAGIFTSWEEGQQTVVLGFRHAIDELHKDVLRKLIASMKEVPGGLEALRGTAQDPLVYAVLRHHGLLRASLQERVEQALDSIRPMLAAHGGNVELVAVMPPDAIEVRFVGNCDNCPSSTLTFVAGVKQAITEHCPEITNIRQVKGAGHASEISFTSPFVKSHAEDWHFAGLLSAVPDGGMAEAQVAGRAILLTRVGSVVHAFDNVCPHFGMPMGGGTMREGRIACPHHGFVFDAASGACLTAPDLHLVQHVVRLDGARIDISLRSA